MIVLLIQISCLIRYNINCRHLSLFCIRDPLYCQGGNFIQYQHLLETTFKPQQKIFLPDTYYTTPVKYLLICLDNYSLKYYSNSHTFSFTTAPTWILLPLPLNPLCGVFGENNNNNKQQVRSWLDLFHPKTSAFSTRALISVHFKTVY